MMNSIIFKRGDHSVVILNPKPTFLDLVTSLAKSQSATLGDIYFPEEDGVFLVPPISNFSDYSKFEMFLNQLKPELLIREFGKFAIPMEKESTAKLFDHFFSITIRDRTEIINTKHEGGSP